MQYDPIRAIELLRLGTQNPEARFREGQAEAIQHVVEGRGRLLVVQKTGWGKSFVYFIATKLLRDQGAGPALLISPLLALMRNQIAAASRMGVQAVRFSSDNKDDWESCRARVLDGQVDIVLSTPEQLSNSEFTDNVLGPVASRISLLVIDEAHCISDWGHDFRPHYRLIQRRIASLPANLRVLATTATANNRVLDDLQTVLGPELTISRGDLNRPSLFLQTITLFSQADRLAWLAEQLGSLDGHGIIYALTVCDSERVAAWLKSRGHNVEAYHSELPPERSHALEDALLANQVKALVATTKLGMGFDKPDLSFVIHYQMPGSVVAYYQQVGRAGRQMAAARGVLLCGREDTDIVDYFIESAFPSPEEVQAVLNALHSESTGLSVNELMTRINATRGRIDKALLLMSLESPPPIVKQDGKWMLTPVELNKGFWERAERLTNLRRAEKLQMSEYLSLQTGHMEFLIKALDGVPRTITAPDIAPLPVTVDPAIVHAASVFLRRSSLPIEPRVQWPAGGLPHMGVSGKIPIDNQARPGKVLCLWGDAGWGDLVRRGKYQDGWFADDLVLACASLVRNWSPQPSPTWLTCIPSCRHPNLVLNFARRLAVALNLSFHPVLIKTDDRAEQKSMANSFQQARNVDGSLCINTPALPPGPVLLVDDMVDSRWTMTIAAYLLTTHQSGPVFPLALALTRYAE